MLTFQDSLEIAKRLGPDGLAKAKSESTKLTHAEVAYVDHPVEGERCERCWKYRAARPYPDDPEPYCLKVQSPISPTGWCKNFERQSTPGEQAGTWIDDVIARPVGKALTFDEVFTKYSESQPRDSRGRWTIGGTTAAAPSGGAHNKQPRVGRGQGTAADKRGRYWVYDHNWNLLDTFKTLTAAKDRGMAHTQKYNLPAHLYDSQNQREAKTSTFRPGPFEAAKPKWLTDAKGRMAWRDTSKEDAVVERYASDRAAYERKHGPVGKAMFYGEMRKRFAKDFNPDEPRDNHGRWSVSVVTEINPDHGTPSILSVHADATKGEQARAKRDATAWDDDGYAQVHHVDVQGGPATDKVHVVASTSGQNDQQTTVHGVYADPTVAKQAAEEMSKYDWQYNGQERDYHHVWEEDQKAGKNSWEADINEWNSTHPGNLMPAADASYRFGDNPGFEKFYSERHGIGEIMPYPGLRVANEYFQDGSPESVYRVSSRLVSKMMSDGQLNLFDDVMEKWNPKEPRDRKGKWRGRGRHRTAKAFDPDEPRDDAGKWTADGSGKGGPNDQATREREAGHTEISQFVSALHAHFTSSRAQSLQRQVDLASQKFNEKQAKVKDLQTQLSNGSHTSSSDRYWGIHDQLALATEDMHQAQRALQARTEERDGPVHGLFNPGFFGKAFNPDEARDALGRWTSGSGAPDHPDFLSYTERDDLLGAQDRLSDHLATKVYDAEERLSDKANEQEDISDGEDDAAEHGYDSAQYKTWESANQTAGEHMADAAMKLRQALASHVDMASKELADFDAKMNRFADPETGYGVRVKKLAVGDVHGATALGNGEFPKPKAKDFLTTIAEIKGGGRIVEIHVNDESGAATGGASDGRAPASKRGQKPSEHGPRDVFDTSGGALSRWPDHHAQTTTKQPIGKGKDGDGTILAHFMRHGRTKHNNQTDMSQDRVRSWNDIPLTDEGREDAVKAGEKLSKEGIKLIISSDLGRAIESSKLVKKAMGGDGVRIINTPLMRPWNLGDFTGMTTEEAHDGIKHYIENPDEVVPNGESFNDFRDRAFDGMVYAIEQAKGEPFLVISHHRNERLFASSGKPPRRSAKVDSKAFLKPGEDPGDLTTFEFTMSGLGKAKGDVGKANGDVPNVSLQLQPLNDGSVDADQWARSPFPWDPNVKATMRPDQVKPFLGALTDPEDLPVKTLLLRTCIAMQDRVDPQKVQSMMESVSDKLPVVARLGDSHNPRNVIIDGHHRMTARFLQGRQTAQVRYIDLTTPQKANAEAKEEEVGETSDGNVETNRSSNP